MDLQHTVPDFPSMIRWPRERWTRLLRRGASAVCCLGVMLIIPCAQAQLLLNEANAVSDTEGPGFLSADPGLPYEGYDYGAMPYSGNTNLPIDPNEPGNPFAPDVSSASGVQTSLVDGFDVVSNPRGFARIQHNGGEWIELTVTHDHTDLRSMTFYWIDDFNDNGVYGELQSQNAGLTENERGAVRFSNHQELADVRAGTIITISENAIFNEIRDDYPYGFVNRNLDDTGYDYDLNTDLSFDPYDGQDDWHVHFHLDESVTAGGNPTGTEFFHAHSELEVSNEQWAGKLFDATSDIVSSVRNPALIHQNLDTTTGAITDFVGEDAGIFASGFGAATGATGVGDDEAIALLSAPDSGEVDNGYYEDLDWSTFGMPNLFNRRTDGSDLDGDGVTDGDIVAGASEDDTTLSQMQDFSGLRAPVRDQTYDWSASGSADFAAVSNWQLANDNSPASSGPGATWTARLVNDAGGQATAQVNSDVEVAFLTVMASSGSLELVVQPQATLTVQGSTRPDFESPGRVLVMAGGVVRTDGQLVATQVETFAGGVVAGDGLISGDLLNSGGTVAPGADGVGTLNVAGDYVQDADRLWRLRSVVPRNLACWMWLARRRWTACWKSHSTALFQRAVVRSRC